MLNVKPVSALQKNEARKWVGVGCVGLGVGCVGLGVAIMNEV